MPSAISPSPTRRSPQSQSLRWSLPGSGRIVVQAAWRSALGGLQTAGPGRLMSAAHACQVVFEVHAERQQLLEGAQDDGRLGASGLTGRPWEVASSLLADDVPEAARLDQ